MAFSSVDLYFSHNDDPPRLCFEVHGLNEDEIEVLLAALKQRFNQTDVDTYIFSTKSRHDYSKLEWVKRERAGDWMDSGIYEPVEQLRISLNTVEIDTLPEKSRIWIKVRNTAIAMSGEINRLRSELNCNDPVKSSVLPRVSRDELLEHLDGIEYSPPKQLAQPATTYKQSTIEPIQTPRPTPTKAPGSKTVKKSKNKGGRKKLSEAEANTRREFYDEVILRKNDGIPMKMVAEEFEIDQNTGKAWMQWVRDQQKTNDK